MSKTIEEINEALLSRLTEIMWLANNGYKHLKHLNYNEEGLKEARETIGMTNRLIEYACNRGLGVKSQTQELIEQNRELLEVLQNVANLLESDSGISVESIKRVLTKYDHLKSNTNG